MNRTKVIFIICTSLALFILLLVGVLIGIHQKPEEITYKKDESLEASVGGKWNEGVITYKGTEYRYNFSMETYLCLGIDKEGVVEAVPGGLDGGQSDSIFLIAFDHKKEKISVIGVNRNTMTDVDMYDADGNFKETRKLQLCLQHGYGDGADISCTRTVAAVQKLFHDIPIDGYFSLNMGGIPILNDAVGGVRVCVLEDVPVDGKTLKQGSDVTLSGREAYSYIRYRDYVFDSVSMRLERQMQYILALFSQLKAYAGGNAVKAVEVFEQGEKYICTNVIYSELAETLLQYGFDESNMYSVQGRTIKGEKFEEYHIDRMALQELVLEIFYEKVE